MFIADRGRPAYVLLGIEDYRRLAEIGFEPPRVRIESRPPPLSCAGCTVVM